MTPNPNPNPEPEPTYFAPPGIRNLKIQHTIDSYWYIRPSDGGLMFWHDGKVLRSIWPWEDLVRIGQKAEPYQPEPDDFRIPEGL